MCLLRDLANFETTDSELDVNIPPNAGTSRVKLTPLGVAIVMQYDEIVSSLLNSEPSMVVFEDTIITTEPNEEDSDPPELKEEEDCLDHVMLNGKKTLQEDATENEDNEDNESNDDGNDDDSEDEDDEDDGVEEKVAMEAIQLAADYGSAQATRMLLLQWGQDPLPDGYEALHVPVLPDTIETLLNWGANIEEPDHKKQRTPLIWCAALNGPLDKMDTLLRRRANPNAQDKYLKTALHYAAIYNRVDMVQRLLDNKAVIEVEDDLGNSPLHYVVEQPQHYAIAKLLVGKGASLKHKNKAGQDPMDIAVESKADNGETYLMLAVSLGSRFVLGKCSCANIMDREARCRDGGTRSS